MQGWYARVYTGLALGLVAAAGGMRIYEASNEYRPYWRIGLPAAFAVVLGWIIFRIVQFPPFAEFLIATEAEMNKVSWTNKEDLIRSTTVVLMTVVLMAVFLFVVDRLWTFILQLLGVLRFGGGGGFGSTAWRGSGGHIHHRPPAWFIAPYHRRDTMKRSCRVERLPCLPRPRASSPAALGSCSLS